MPSLDIMTINLFRLLKESLYRGWLPIFFIWAQSGLAGPRAQSARGYQGTCEQKARAEFVTPASENTFELEVRFDFQKRRFVR